MDQTTQLIIVGDILKVLAQHKVSGIESVAMLEFIKFNILSGNLKPELEDINNG